MHRILLRLGILIALTGMLAACAGTSAVKYKYQPNKEDPGYRFVIPRTVVKVSQSKPPADKSTDDSGPSKAMDSWDRAPKVPDKAAPPPGSSGGPLQLSFTTVPVSSDQNGNPYPIYSVTDDSGGWKLVSTSITNVKYADYLIVQSIGTQVTDNRKDAVDTIVSLVGLFVGAKARAEFDQKKTCPADGGPLADFLIEDFKASSAPIPSPNNACWAYSIIQVKEAETIDPAVFPISTASSALPIDKKTPWFPYPACKSITVAVFPCPNGNASCKDPGKGDSRRAEAVLSVADGTALRRVMLPQKGKIEMHSDFCVADVTSDASPLSSDYSLLSEAIKDVKDLSSKK